jgi:hypothetical protein
MEELRSAGGPSKPWKNYARQLLEAPEQAAQSKLRFQVRDDPVSDLVTVALKIQVSRDSSSRPGLGDAWGLSWNGLGRSETRIGVREKRPKCAK